MRTINKIIVHCSDTPAGRHTTVEEIRDWHKQRGWSDIGYNYVVYLDGTVHEGRDIEKIPAHTKGHNKDSIGVCYIGGGKGIDTRTEDQKDALVDLLVYLKTTYPKARIYGHRDFSDKYCPSFDATKEYMNISNMWE
jgi:N-acetylmuramoyl-L-alanine amidase